MSNDLIPGRPATDHAKGCPFCLANELFRGELIVKGEHGFVGLVAPDLALLCPYEHLANEVWFTPFGQEFMSLAGRGIAVLVARFGWTDYNVVLNFGYVAGQRVWRGEDDKWYHPHAKLLQRASGQPASNWGLDALVKMVNGCPHPHKP